MSNAEEDDNVVIYTNVAGDVPPETAGVKTSLLLLLMRTDTGGSADARRYFIRARA